MSKRFDQTESKKQWLAQRHKNSNNKQSSLGITLQTRPQHLPLSFAQQRLWFLEQWEPGSTAYLLPFAWRLQGPLKITSLETSLTELVARHESLRTSVSLFQGQPVQIIASKAPALLPFHDLTSLSEVARATELQRLIQEETHQPFDLTLAPLWRGQLIRLGAEEHVLLLTLHHIITDGWSMGVFFKEWTMLYQRQTTGQPTELPQLPLQYADYAIWQRQKLQGKELDRQRTYWGNQLAEAPPSLDLQTDFSRPPQQTYRGEQLRFTLPVNLTQALKTFSRHEGVTLFMTMLTAFQLLLFRYSGQHDIPLGTPIAGRTHTKLEGLIGFFVNTLVLRTHVKGQATFLSVLQQVRETCLEAYAHQDLPFEKLVEALQPVRDPSRHPIFQVMFQMHQEEVNNGFILPNVQVESIQETTPSTTFDLLLRLVLTQENIKGTFIFNTDLFASGTIKQLATHYQKLLESLLENPNQAVSHIPLLTNTERQRLDEWNNTTQKYSGTKCVHLLFEEQVERTPEAIAIVFEDQQLTYRELNRRANQLAHYLREQGVRSETKVGLCLDRSLEMLTSLLAVLKAGGAYVPLDPTYPEERLKYIVTHCKPQCILTESELCPWLTHTDSARINLDPDWSGFAHYPQHNPDSLPSSLNLAYVIYTSGSTGNPKGVMVTHKGVSNLLQTIQEHVGIDKAARLLAVTSLSFDISVLELFGLLIVGGRLVLTGREVATDGMALRTVLQSQAITIMQATPSTWGMLIQTNPEPLPRPIKILCGGESLSAHLAHQLESWGATIWNVYGPTETTIWSTFWKLESVKEGISIGRPLANTTVFLVDQNEELVPIGLPGEILIGGDGVARGYHSNPTLTAEKFIPHPYSPERGERLYQSGDMAKYGPDGALEFLGRRDHQVKLRGFRIECGEIETTLTAHPSIKEAIVLCREDGPGDKTLVAYVVPNNNNQPTITEVQTWLKRTLPDYMVPSGLVVLKALPLTPNGKVDRKALPAPNQTHRARTTAYVPPRTPVENLVAGIWRDLLKMNQISVHDNFFELGGHSLLATQVIARLRPLASTKVSLRTFFDGPTIAELSSTLQPSQPAVNAPASPLLCPQVQESPSPLSFSQQRLWFLEQWQPGNIAYLLPYAWRVTGPLNVHALEASLTALMNRHGSLRTTIASVRNQPVQMVAPASTVTLSLQDLTSLPAARREEQVQCSVQDDQQQPFDLTTGPLWRGQLLRLGVEEHVLLLTFHHLITDGWSMGLFFQELKTLYTAQVTGQSLSLPPQSITYADFAIWQRQWLQGEALDRQLSYWRTQLADAPPSLDLSTDFPRPPQVSYRGNQVSFTLPSPLTHELDELSRQEGVTLFMTLLAAFQLLLFRYTGQRDILVGTPIAGRTHIELEGLIGFFVNTLVLRTGFTGQENFQDLLLQVKETCLDAYAHQDLPFEKLVEALQPVRDLSRHPVFQISFQLHQAALTSDLTLPQVQVQAIQGTNQTAKFELSLELVLRDKALHGIVFYNTDLFEANTITRLATHYQTLLKALVENPTKTMSHLPLLSKNERQQLLTEWNPQISPEQPTLCVHHLFEAQVSRTPESMALVEGDKHLTYAALNQRANQLAQKLRGHCVGPEVKVGICLERGVDLIICLLGILKAGGAYVPLDPTTPTDRLHFILEDAEVALLLTSAAVREKLSDGLCPSPSSLSIGPSVIAIDEAWPEIAETQAQPFSSDSNGNHLAYVMYTSGSTGQPKGVGIPHQAVIRLIQNPAYVSWPSQVNCLQLASVAFDATTFEIWGCLAQGGTLVLAPPLLPSFDELGVLLQRHQITILWLTAGLFHQLVDWDIQTLRPVQTLLAGGDVLSPSHIRRMGAQLPSCQLINGYGPTENTTFTCCFSIPTTGDLGHSIPIGRPIAQTQVYVLDAQQQLMPKGVPGELYIGGVGLARGYYQQPALTAEKFIPHPYSTEPGARLYRSGDMVKYRPDGTLEFLGRQDHQVKIRGYRIECGEIETILTRHPAVQEVVVLPRGDRPGDKRLVAYIVREKGSSPHSSELRDYLGRSLPSYMIPTHYVFLDAFPLNSNGKIDQSNLPAEDHPSSLEEGTYVAPRNSLEEHLTKIWETVLEKQPIGITENFFNLGGESLMAVRLCSEMERALQQKIPVSLIFQAQTIEQLAKNISQHGETKASPLVVPIQTSGSNPPIFGVLFGSTFMPFMKNYPDQPFYMFFNQGHDGNPAMFTTVEEIAHWYLKEMRTIQPQGPYYLAGYSFGGMVAYEMAQQLRAQGETIGLLALMDPTPTDSQTESMLRKMHLEGPFTNRAEEGHQQSHSIMRLPRSFLKKLLAAAQWRVKNLPGQSSIIIKYFLCKIFFGVGYPLPTSLRPWYRTRIVQQAASRYIPQKYPGQVVLFKSHKFVDAAWQQLCAEVAQVYDFPVGHLDLVDGPHTETLLQKLMDCLKLAQKIRTKAHEADSPTKENFDSPLHSNPL